MTEWSDMLGNIFDEDVNVLPKENASLLSFDMWCSCSAKNIEHVTKRNQSLKPIRLYLLKLVLEFCKMADVQPFVYGGTALGVYREGGKMIQHDSDIDLAVLERDAKGKLTFTKLLRTCIEHGVTFSGVAGNFPLPHVEEIPEIHMTFDSRRTFKTWLHVDSAGPDAIFEELYGGRDCKIAKFYLSKTGIQNACDMFHMNINAFNQLMSDPSLAHVDLFTLSPHPDNPISHLRVNWDIPGVYDSTKKMFPIHSFFPLRDCFFEDICVNRPADLEAYLKLEYGYLGKDAMYDYKKQLYIQVPEEMRNFLPTYMLNSTDRNL